MTPESVSDSISSPVGTRSRRFRISPPLMLLLLCTPALITPVYCLIARLVSPVPLNCLDYLVFLSLLAIVIVGGFQIFFWVQDNNHYFTTRCLKITLDDHIPFWPSWIWVYSGLFYLLVGLAAVAIRSIEEGVYVIFGGLVLLLVQSVCFLAFPCTVPPSWREYEPTRLSLRLLRFGQEIDNGRNCFPSMHCSVATYAGLVMLPTLGGFAYAVIALTCVSGLFVKQHQILDVLAGVALGWAVHTVMF